MSTTTQEQVQLFAETINKSTHGAIVVPPNPNQDAIASATALFLGLVKLGKNISLVSQSPITSDLTASDKFTDELVHTGDNLIVSFPYHDGAIDKVDYNIKNNTFNLVITPRAGFEKLNPEKVQFSYSGGNLDFIVCIDAPNLGALGSLYKENEKEFSNTTLINIDRHLVNDLYGKVNIVDKTISSTAQLVLKLLIELHIDIDRDISTNLYAGLVSATNTFASYSVNADTFEAASQLMRFGAVKKTQRPVTPQSPMQQPQIQRPAPRQPMPMNQRQPQNTPQSQQIGSQPAPKEESRTVQIQTPTRSIPVAEQPQAFAGQNQNDTQTQSNESTPQDWLKPKIFRGGGLA